jgi:CheY-like chemotaxis protein
MPRLDGLAATEQIRAHSELDRVPIIAVTAFDTYGIREVALEAGCQDYLHKPLNPGALERAIRGALPGFVFEHGAAQDTSNGR